MSEESFIELFRQLTPDQQDEILREAERIATHQSQALEDLPA
jgi:hypothetical protein